MTLWMLGALLTSTLVALWALVGDRIAARFGVPRRFVWIAALLTSSLMPVVTGLRSAPVPSDIGPTASIDPATQRQASAWRSLIGADRDATGKLLQERSWQARSARMMSIARRIDPWLLTAWLVASSVMLTWLLLRFVMLHRERRAWGTVEESGLTLLVASAAGPAAVGILRPRIVIPSWLLDEDVLTRALLLRHESEHVRAGDTRVLFAAMILEALLPWNIPLRWIVHRLRLAIEIDCDARVVAHVGDARRYSLALLAAAERHAVSVPISAGLLESRLGIEARIHAMIRRRSRRPVRAAVWLAALAALVGTLSASMPRPALRSPEALAGASRETAGTRAVREFLAAYNDPDTSRIVSYVTTAFAHGRPGPRRSAVGFDDGPFGPWDAFIRDRLAFGKLVLQRIVPRGEWLAEYAVIEQGTGRELVGYIVASERQADWIENFGLLYNPAGLPLEDPAIQARLYPDVPNLPRRIREALGR